ncbi:DUF639 domain-containing protein [Cephalotus follicularis]|uniref:DUF639 domain-containing protein n=1 Tax=Cephalotus follicularis TaxID=3775 RepID=A0A1Q3DGQ0_CEPFO|nr:DUF639 domain-containing protein [Cephalotus follicularis]
MTNKKHLSSIANDVVQRCALKLDTSVEKMEEEFEAQWSPKTGDYSRKFVEYCCSKAIVDMCQSIEEKIRDGSFSRFTFDMMLAWEMPSSADEESHAECVAKEREDGKRPTKVPEEQDEIPLFYSDLMLLLVDDGPSVVEDSFVWLGLLVPIVADVVNGRFTFETLTAPTGNRLYFPAYDKFLKEIDECIKHLQKQAPPKGVELADDEFILHVDGTASTQRVVRHIGLTNWPGKLTLTNYALYFEASGKLTYEDAIKIDLSKDTEHRVKTAATGPFGAPLFDKAIVYESPELSEEFVLEFPELTSSTRRDLWLSLIKEIILSHQFLKKYKAECPIQAWEMHARTILGIVRLHAARQMLRMWPPAPTKFLIFALFDEIPKGDYVLEELANSLKKVNSGHPCSASSLLRNMNMPQPIISSIEVNKVGERCEILSDKNDNYSSLKAAVDQAREEAKEVEMAKATTLELKEELGIGESAQVLMELLRPAASVLPWFEQVLSWEKPVTTLIMIASTILIVYKEWIGKALAAFLLWVVAKMIRAKQVRTQHRRDEIVVHTGCDKSTIETIVSAQRALREIHEMMQAANIAILICQSILEYRSPKHTNKVIMAMSGLAILLAVIPLKFIIMAVLLHCFIMNSKLGRYIGNEQGNRRLREWWESIPITPVRIVDEVPNSST